MFKDIATHAIYLLVKQTIEDRLATGVNINTRLDIDPSIRLGISLRAARGLMAYGQKHVQMTYIQF